VIKTKKIINKIQKIMKERQMKKNWKRIASLFLSVLLLLSMTVTPVMAAEGKAAPTEVKSCTVTGFMPEYMALEFEDTDWMNKISSVTVNEIDYTKGTLGWGSSGNLWEVGSAMGVYGSYTALKLTNPSYPATIKITAEGYQDLNLEVTKDTSTYPYVYTATVKKDTTGGNTEATYTAMAKKASNGTVALDKDKDLKAGDTVTVTATPAENYEIDAVTVTTENNKNVASGSNTAMVHNSQPSDNNTKAETKADMDTQALQETDTNSTEEAKVSDDSEYTTDEQADDDSDNKDQSDSEDNNEWNGLDEGTNEASDEASGDTVDNRITICIDPGHGGSNEGTKENYDGTLIKEKNITMTIARKLKYYLEQNDNIRVVMTRNSDTAVSLAGRIEYAAANNADYVISMHINSKSTDELDAHGCMVLMSCSRYQPENARFTSIYDRERSLAYSILAKLNGIGIPIANDSWNGNEYKDGILQRLNTVNELYPDGSMADYYGLINEGTCAGIPTIIVEHAFLSNVNDYRNYLSTDAQLDALARADAAGILEAVLQ